MHSFDNHAFVACGCVLFAGCFVTPHNSEKDYRFTLQLPLYIVPWWILVHFTYTMS